MGGGQSTPEEENYGYHVLHVMDNSPAEKAGIEPFFDFIVGINDTRLSDEDPEELMQHLVANKGRKVRLHVYSSKNSNVREVTLVPADDWGPTIKSSLIGCSIRYCSYQSAAENVWHVLDVAADSPASIAGLQPYTDYIVGAPRVTLASQDDFYDLIGRHNGQEMRLHVYNVNWDCCREVMIVPNSEWGGQGSLGCDIGYGLLHRIPSRNPRRASIQELRQQEGERQDPRVTIEAAQPTGQGDDASAAREPPQTAPAEYKSPALKTGYAPSKRPAPVVGPGDGSDASREAAFEERPAEEPTSQAGLTARASPADEESKRAELDGIVRTTAAGGTSAEEASSEPASVPGTDGAKGAVPADDALLPKTGAATSPAAALPQVRRSSASTAPPYGDTVELAKQLSIDKSRGRSGD